MGPCVLEYRQVCRRSCRVLTSNIRLTHASFESNGFAQASSLGIERIYIFSTAEPIIKRQAVRTGLVVVMGRWI